MTTDVPCRVSTAHKPHLPPSTVAPFLMPDGAEWSFTQKDACLLDVMVLGNFLDSCESSVNVPGYGAVQPPLLVLQLSLQLIGLPVQSATQFITHVHVRNNTKDLPLSGNPHAWPSCLARLIMMTPNSMGRGGKARRREGKRLTLTCDLWTHRVTGIHRASTHDWVQQGEPKRHMSQHGECKCHMQHDVACATASQHACCTSTSGV